MKLKWVNNIYFEDKDIENYFRDQRNVKILFFLAKGFDPRMCECINLLKKAGCNFDVCLIEFSNSSNSPYKDIIDKNYEELKKIASFKTLNIMRSLSSVEIALKKNLRYDDIKNYNEIIIDISAMPQALSFNLIKHVHCLSQSKHIVSIMICENSDLDDSIRPLDLSDTARYLNGFSVSRMEMDSIDDSRTVWIPLVNNRCDAELGKVYDHILPDEICPVLPFPSKNPRKSDIIIMSEVGSLLLNTFGVEKRNIIYVPENNVVQIYKKLCYTVEHYNQVLNMLGISRFVFTICANKIGELGALLASLEITAAEIINSFAIVEYSGYRFDSKKYKKDNNNIYYFNLSRSVFEL